MRVRVLAVLPLLVLGCKVRGSGPSDLVGSVPDKATVDAAAADQPKRIEIKCENPPQSSPSAMVNVPAGAFSMGCNASVDTECRDDERPEHDVTLDAFDVDVTEVTQGQYYACVAAGTCQSPACDWDPCEDGQRKDFPVVCVDHDDALAYCAWAGKRLPTEAEWEKAARGTDARKYPWGNDGLDCAHANFFGCAAAGGKDGTLKPGTLTAGASPYGALDMAGNVAEWVTDYYDPDYFKTSPATEPKGPATAARFVGRGGGWRSLGVWERTSQRDDYEETYVKDSGGFRCIK
jgi:formylglycine-generating enzyme required for sulfatase activity